MGHNSGWQSYNRSHVLRLSCCIGVQAPEQELDLELPDDMALDGDQGDEEEQEVKEDEAGNQQPDNSVQQPFQRASRTRHPL